MSHADLERLAESGCIRSDDGLVLIGQNTVKLHVGDTAWLPDKSIGDRRVHIDKENPLTLGPGEILTVITKERVQIPLNLTGHMYPRGRLLPVGILVPTTHIDPGFSGYLRVILANIGMNIIRLPAGYEIARAEFSTLSSAVDTPYHGVNALLKELNPQSDDLIIESVPNVRRDLSLPDLVVRISRIEEYVQNESTRHRRARAINLTAATTAACAAAVFLLLLFDRKQILGYSKDVISQVAAAGIVALFAVAFAVTRPRINAFIRRLLDGKSQLLFQDHFR